MRVGLSLSSRERASLSSPPTNRHCVAAHGHTLSLSLSLLFSPLIKYKLLLVLAGHERKRLAAIAESARPISPCANRDPRSSGGSRSALSFVIRDVRVRPRRIHPDEDGFPACARARRDSLRYRRDESDDRVSRLVPWVVEGQPHSTGNGS